MVRVNISIDQETLRLADREARRRKMSRSELIRVAVREVAEDGTRVAEEETRRRRQREAAEALDRFARKVGDWPAEEILRSWRYRLEGKH